MEQKETNARHWPLQTLSAVLVIAFDWATLALNLVLWIQGYVLATIIMALLAGLAVAWVEYKHAPSLAGLASIKGVLVAVLVSLPLPLFGTLLGLTSLIATLFLRRRNPTLTVTTK